MHRRHLPPPCLQCYQVPHLTLALALGLPCIVLFCVGVPLSSFLYLRKNKAQLGEPLFAARYSFLYQDYRRG